MINFNDYRSILCLNGILPDASFFQCAPHLPIIAADGASNALMQMQIEPHLVIGDLDSIEPSLLTKLKTLYHYDQNFCDFYKSLDYLRKQNLLPSIIVGMNGGYLDHILNNINIFLNSNSILYAPPIWGYVLQAHESKSHTLPYNTKISLIGLPSAEITSQGLKWELLNYQMSFPGKNSCFNRTIQENVTITVEQGIALILIYQETATTSEVIYRNTKI